MGFNPSKAKQYQDVATLNLVDPETGEEVEVDGKPVSITVMGQAHPKYLKAVEVMSTAREKRERQGKKTTLAEGREDSINFLASISVTSENLEDDDGNPITTKEQFKELYGNDAIAWVRNQVSEFAGKDTNFFKK